MYESFYGLTRTPFAVTPDPAMLFMSKVHREALATIIYGVETRKGFIVCTGEVGTGKSTIIRAFFDQTSADAVKLIYIFTPQVTPLEMSRYICGELGLEDPDSIFAAVPRLQLKLLEEFEAGRTVVLMIDEAQLLPPETLEFLRLLSNFETDTEKLIQIVLVGQPEVDTLLARPDMRQVSQRVALRARLAAFSAEESVDYIEHRLRISGAGELAQIMSPSAAWLIVEAAGGIPRIINILADNALIAGFAAGQRPLGSQLAARAVGEFLGNSEAAAPVVRQRLGAGWRAARRLRSALVREQREPVEWDSAVPAATPPPAAPLAKPPAPPGGTPVWPGPVRARVGPPAQKPFGRRPAPRLDATLAGPNGAGWEIAPLAANAPANAAAPTADSGVAFGTPASTAGMTIVEPVAQPVALEPVVAQPVVEQSPTLPSPPFRRESEGLVLPRLAPTVSASSPQPSLSRKWRVSEGPGTDRRLDRGSDVNDAATVGSPVGSLPGAAEAAPNGTTMPPAAADLTEAAVRWPALSRVRSGLQAVQRRDQNRV